MARIEYRYRIGGGFDGLLIFDGRVIEFCNLGPGGSARFPYPETTIERSEPNRKGKVEYTFRTPGGSGTDFPVDADAVAGFDEFLAKVQKAAG